MIRRCLRAIVGSIMRGAAFGVVAGLGLILMMELSRLPDASVHWTPWRVFTPVGDECCPDCSDGATSTAYRKTKRPGEPSTKKKMVGATSQGAMCGCIQEFEECRERQRERAQQVAT